MKYKFEQFLAEIENPTMTITGVRDSMNSTCSVDIKLSSNGTELGVNLSGFTYSETWEDSDIIAWVNIELQKFKI